MLKSVVKKNVKKNKKRYGKGVIKGDKTLITAFRLQSTTYFLTYKGISDTGQTLTKEQLANYLLNQNPNDVKLKPEKYLVCEEMYDSGQPHFHVILVYPKRKEVYSQKYYNYLGVHPNIQTMRNMKAALEYVYKEDPNPLTNMNVVQERRRARAKDSSSLYELFQEQMLKDPWNFDVYSYCSTHDIFRQVYQASFNKAVYLVGKAQEAHCNHLLGSKASFRTITRSLVQQRLTLDELVLYDSWSGYQTIVDHLNQIPRYNFRRPAKTMNLLITGPKSIGKSALVWQQYPEQYQHPLNQFCSVYPMGMKDWFPNYRSQVYSIIYWNEMKLTSYPYDTILQLLDGSPIMLPAKGTSHKKVDNPIVIMASNMTLPQMIYQKFHYNKKYQQLSKQNLSVRITNVIVPPNLDLFLLQKLFVKG